MALVEGAVFALLLAPRWFGFKKVTPALSVRPTRLPLQFWGGGACMLFFWWLMWSGDTRFGSLVYYAFTPLWWGLILTLDGLVYSRSGGRSLLTSRPGTLLASACVSVVGWYVFEYLDYFLLSNWYYPNGHLPMLSRARSITIFLVAYSTVWPSILEWYALLNTFPALSARYAKGPRLPIPGAWLVCGGTVAMICMVCWPDQCFWAVWLGPFALAGLLMNKGIWTPFAPLREGNWTPMVLIALASLCDGFFWELWNFGSAHFHTAATNPNYWIYVIPYVDKGHVYSEMPLLGYAGYLPFGIVVWLLFIWAGEAFGFNYDISVELPTKSGRQELPETRLSLGRRAAADERS